jgi:hypothetical protein
VILALVRVIIKIMFLFSNYFTLLNYYFFYQFQLKEKKKDQRDTIKM